MSVGTMASLFVGIAVSLLVGLMGVYIGDGMVTGNPSLLHDHRSFEAGTLVWTWHDSCLSGVCPAYGGHGGRLWRLASGIGGECCHPGPCYHTLHDGNDNNICLNYSL